MKYAIVLGDGMSDRAVPELEGKTPLEVAKIPAIHELARRGTVGSAKTIPRGLKAASDVANLAVLGYDPKAYYTGRGPLEAANMGITLAPDEIAFRCNLITANNDTLADYSAGHIIDKESTVLIEALQRELGSDRIRFHHGKSYRHLVVIKARGDDELAGLAKTACHAPHDIAGKSISRHLPKGRGADLLISLMEKSRAILEKHEINRVRVDLKENPASMIWLWGQGTNPHMPLFKGIYGIDGAVISAVDLVNGIGRLIGFEVVQVPGVTGYYDTNYEGKGSYAIKALERVDIVFVHIEAPDEAGHNGDVRAKVSAIESIDKHIVAPLSEAFKGSDEFRMMVLPDHGTPIAVRTHVSDPIPFVMAGQGIPHNGFDSYSEKVAEASAVKFKTGPALTNAFIKGL